MGMDNAQILSAITGTPVEDVRDDINRHEKSSLISFSLLKEFKKSSRNEAEYMCFIEAHVIMMLNEFKIEARAVMLMHIMKLLLSDSVKKGNELFNKFKQNGKKKITKSRRHRQDK